MKPDLPNASAVTESSRASQAGMSQSNQRARSCTRTTPSLSSRSNLASGRVAFVPGHHSRGIGFRSYKMRIPPMNVSGRRGVSVVISPSDEVPLNENDIEFRNVP